MKGIGSRSWFPLLGLLLGLLLGIGVGPVRAQTVLSLDSAEAQTLRRHPRLRQADEEIAEQRALKRGSFAPANPDFLLAAPTGEMWAPGVVQTIDLPNVYRRQRQVAQAGITLAERNREVSRASVLRDTRLAYLTLQFAAAQVRQFTAQDSLYRALRLATDRLFAAGEVTSLQRISTDAEARQITVQLQQATDDLRAAQRRLGLLLGQPTATLVASTDLRQTGRALTQTGAALLRGLPLEDSSALLRSPALAYATQSVALSQSGISLVRARRTPALTVGYQNQAFENSALKYRFQFGVSVPIWFWTYRSQLQAATARARSADYQLQTQRLELGSQYQQALADTRKFSTSLAYYEQTGVPQAQAIISQSQRLFRAGEISYLFLIQSLNQAFTIQQTYLTTIRDYQQALVELNYLRGE